jgi:RNA polymerase sigma-70 factor (ECF subfamily)
MVSVAARMRTPPAPESDEQLLLRYRDTGDERAFEALVHRYERELYSYLVRYLKDTSLAEEVFQEVFLRVHKKARLFESGRPCRPWLYAIATHLAIDKLRRVGRHKVLSLERGAALEGEEETGLIDLLEQPGAGPLEQLEDAERRRWIRQAVDDLPEHLRQVILLVYFQGLKYSEAAAVLGIPIGTVKSRMHAALVKLGEAWQQAETHRGE